LPRADRLKTRQLSVHECRQGTCDLDHAERAEAQSPAIAKFLAKRVWDATLGELKAVMLGSVIAG
jgi:hypothetical protein